MILPSGNVLKAVTALAAPHVAFAPSFDSDAASRTIVINCSFLTGLQTALF